MTSCTLERPSARNWYAYTRTCTAACVSYSIVQVHMLCKQHQTVHASCFMQFDWLVREKIADGALISKWRKPGYEFVCSLISIQKSSHNFGTTSHCRVPLKNRAGPQRVTPDVQTGCISCASCTSSEFPACASTNGSTQCLPRAVSASFSGLRCFPGREEILPCR